MATPLLNITTISTGSSSKEALISGAYVEIEDALQRGLTVDVTSDVTLTSTQWTRYYYYNCTPVSGSRNLTVPLTVRTFAVKNSGTGTLTVKGATGGTVVLNAGESALLFNTGSAITSILINTATVNPHDIGLFIPGIPPDGELVSRYQFTRSVEFPDDFSGSKAAAVTASSSAATFDIQKNGVSVGSIDFSFSDVGVFTTSGGSVSFADGDFLSIISPTPIDSTLESISITLKGIRL